MVKKSMKYRQFFAISFENSLEVELLDFTFQTRWESRIHSRTTWQNYVLVQRWANINVGRLNSGKHQFSNTCNKYDKSMWIRNLMQFLNNFWNLIIYIIYTTNLIKLLNSFLSNLTWTTEIIFWFLWMFLFEIDSLTSH